MKSENEKELQLLSSKILSLKQSEVDDMDIEIEKENYGWN